ncbi:hypothetical protein NMY22_g16609 [Coprinellus aureogranulatus]|nr:hypothetical protein NMY22_g16609 [Coprinellus aureogranulatus]
MIFFLHPTQASMWPSYAPLTSQEDDALLDEPSSAIEKSSRLEKSSIKPYALYFFLAAVLILNLTTFAVTLTMQADTLTAITQARDVDSLPRPNPYVGLPSKHCEYPSLVVVLCLDAQHIAGAKIGHAVIRMEVRVPQYPLT